MSTPSPEPASPRHRIAVLVHWMKGLASVPGSALEGAEWAGKVASHDGHLHLAPAWVQAWEEAGRPLHGIQLPPPPGVRTVQEDGRDEDTPEVKALTALMDPLEAVLREDGRITDEEGDNLLDCLWALHDWDHEKSLKFLTTMDRVLRKVDVKKSRPNSRMASAKVDG